MDDLAKQVIPITCRYHDCGSRASGISFTGEVVKRSHNKLDVGTRKLAYRTIFAVVLGTVVGSILPEMGTALAYNFGLEYTHVFNSLFLAIGVIGIGLALCTRHKQVSKRI